MNFLFAIIDAFASFVRRNPIFCLVVLILAVGAPSLLKGIAAVALYAVMVLFILTLAGTLLLRRKLRNISDRMSQQQQQRQQRYYDPHSRREGDVTVNIDRNQTEKRISDDVGDYVDFEEEKNKE